MSLQGIQTEPSGTYTCSRMGTGPCYSFAHAWGPALPKPTQGVDDWMDRRTDRTAAKIVWQRAKECPSDVQILCFWISWSWTGDGLTVNLQAPAKTGQRSCAALTTEGTTNGSDLHSVWVWITHKVFMPNTINSKFKIINKEKLAIWFLYSYK